MDEMMHEIEKWQIKTFGDQESLLGLARHLVEEAKETAVDALIVAESLNENVDLSSLHEEIADVFIILCGVARLAKCDLKTATMAKMAKNKKRKWGDPDDQGKIKHKKAQTKRALKK